MPDAPPPSLAELLALIDGWCMANLGRRPVEVGFRWRDSPRPSWWPMPELPPSAPVGREPPAAALPAGPAAAMPSGFSRHSEDFRSVHWFGTDYTFTPTQAAVVRQLWEAWEDGTPGVGQETLLAGAGSEGSRLRDLFRGHAAMGTLVVALGKGLFALAPPG